jgi:hypothetical protein
MVEQYGRVKRFLSAMLRDLHFQAAPAGEHTLSAIHYLAELSSSKKRILDDAPEHIISGPGNDWYTTEMAGFYALVTRCAFSSVFRTLCAVVISGWRTVTDGVTRVKNCFRELNGTHNGSRYVGRWAIHQTELKQQNNWLRGLMTLGNQWVHVLPATRQSA